MSKTRATTITRATSLRRGRAVDGYDRDGYVIIPDFLDSTLLAAARRNPRRQRATRHAPRARQPLHERGIAASLVPTCAGADGDDDHRDILLVAGEDPYALRGVTDVMHPHIRPDGDGGCIR
jgi:hypothetical protein